MTSFVIIGWLEGGRAREGEQERYKVAKRALKERAQVTKTTGALLEQRRKAMWTNQMISYRLRNRYKEAAARGGGS